MRNAFIIICIVSYFLVGCASETKISAECSSASAIQGCGPNKTETNKPARDLFGGRSIGGRSL